MSAEQRALVGFRLAASGLSQRRAHDALVAVAARGLQDSAPRSAVLALHARMEEVRPDDWQHPDLVQVWGPRGALHVVPAADRAVFTLGLAPRDARARQALAPPRRLAAALREAAPGDEVPLDLVGGRRVDRLAASLTGQLAVRWDGATIAGVAVEPPGTSVEDARLELARRFLRDAGPATARQFAAWAGVAVTDAAASFAILADELVRVEVDGERRVLHEASRDAWERAPEAPWPSGVRLLPPGDPYLTLPDRDAHVPDPQLRSAVWPRSVPPGAVLLDGAVVGTWRRRGRDVTMTMPDLGSEVSAAVEQAAADLPVTA